MSKKREKIPLTPQRLVEDWEQDAKHHERMANSHLRRNPTKTAIIERYRAQADTFGLCAACLKTALKNQVSDQERLSFLIHYGAYVSWSRDREVCNVWFSYDPDDDSNGSVPVEGYPQKCYLSAEEAIDAAILHVRKK